MRLALLGNEARARYLQDRASPGVTVTAVRSKIPGPSTIESMYDEYMYIPGVIDAVQQAEKDGYDAVITGCFGDPGIDACRELVKIPVVAPAEASMHVAASLGYKFSVVTVLDSVVRPLKKLADIYGLAGKLASVRVIGLPVQVVRDNHELALERALRVCRQVIDEDDADAIVMGCGSMSFYADEIAAEVGVPVLSPLVVSLRWAEMLVGAGLSHSKRAFPLPPKMSGYAGAAAVPAASGES